MALDFLKLSERSSDWKTTCPVHGVVDALVVFDGDVANKAYCQSCLETVFAGSISKVTFDANGGPDPS